MKRHIFKGETFALWCGLQHVLRRGRKRIELASATEEEYDQGIVDRSNVCLRCKRSLEAARKAEAKETERRR